MLLVCLKLLKNSLSGVSGNGIIRGRDEGKAYSGKQRSERLQNSVHLHDTLVFHKAHSQMVSLMLM